MDLCGSRCRGGAVSVIVHSNLVSGNVKCVSDNVTYGAYDDTVMCNEDKGHCSDDSSGDIH